ncbi:N/A [soil metagenome]
MNRQTQDALFVEWISEHHRILHRVANSFASGAEREDLMQELLVSLWKAIPSFREESAASTFAYRVLHHSALTWNRGETRRKKRQSLAETHLVAALQEEPPDERLELLYEYIRELPDIDRSVITMALDGLGHAQIGAIMGATQNSISVRIHRIRKQLAKAYTTKRP